MLKSNQIHVFCHLEDVRQIQQNAICQGRGRPQGNINKKEIRLFPKNTIFQGRGRPQGNITKKEIRLFPKNHKTF